MPSKWAFWCKKFTQAGAYEKHLRTAYSNLDIILASTVRYTSSAIAHNTDTETELLHQERYKLWNFHYESDPDSAGREHQAFNDNTANASDRGGERANRTPALLASKEIDYVSSGGAVGDINSFEQECDDLSEDPWALFTSAHDFKQVSWFIQNKVSKS